MRIKRVIPVVVAVAALAVPAAASASVTFVPEHGTGFVGKGDVQTPFGWNDAALQKNAGDVSFRYESMSDDAYEVTCEWDTGNKQIVHHVQRKDANLLDSVAYDLTKADRKNPNGKITGFDLQDLDESTLVRESSGEVPVVGAACPETGNAEGTDNSVDKKITNVELLSSTSNESLWAVHKGVEHQLMWPAPVEPTPAPVEATL